MSGEAAAAGFSISSYYDLIIEEAQRRSKIFLKRKMFSYPISLRKLTLYVRLRKLIG